MRKDLRCFILLVIPFYLPHESEVKHNDVTRIKTLVKRRGDATEFRRLNEIHISAVKRKLKNRVDVLNPIKEMIARKFVIHLRNDSSNEGQVILEYISNGERIEIECSADESDAENLIFLKDQREIESAIRVEGRNKILKINEFDGAKHAGIYLCATPMSYGALESTLVLKRHSPIVGTPYVRECEENMCRNGGKCFAPLIGDTTSFCLCPPDYVGRYCQSHTVSFYAVQNARTGTLIWSLVSIVFLLFILVAILVFFICRYGSERNKRKKYEIRHGILEGSKNNETHREVFAEIGLIGVHQQHNKPPCTTIDDPEDFGSLDSSTNQLVENFYSLKKERSDIIRKHSGFRGRLDATSTSTS